MLNQLNFEQVRRVEHRGLMMTLETKDVWNETDWIILLPETQPHGRNLPSQNQPIWLS